MIAFRPVAVRLAALAAVIAAAPLATPASAEVVKEMDNGFVTRDSAVVSASPYETWQALIVPGKWWNDSHTWSGDADNMYISVQGGGCFCELLPERAGAPEGVRRGSVQHMVVVQADPPRALRLRGGLGPLQSEPVDGVLTITLQPEGEGTKIVWEYVVGGYMRFDVATISKAVDGVMSQQLGGLAGMLGPVAVAEEPAAEADPEPELEAEPMTEIEDADDVGAALDAMARRKEGGR